MPQILRQKLLILIFILRTQILTSKSAATKWFDSPHWCVQGRLAIGFMCAYLCWLRQSADGNHLCPWTGFVSPSVLFFSPPESGRASPLFLLRLYNSYMVSDFTMVEVAHGVTDAIADEDSIPALSSPRLLVTSSHLIEDPMTAIRRTAATKRTLMKMRTSRNAANRSPLSGSPRDESKSPSSPSSSADEDPKRSKADKCPNDESDPCKYSPSKLSHDSISCNGQARPIFQRRIRNHSAPVSLTLVGSSKSPTEIVCDVGSIFLPVTFCF